MMRKSQQLGKVLSAILLLVCGSSIAGALEITLESAAELALGNNRLLLAGYTDQNVLQREKRSSWNEFMPQLYAGTGLTRANEALPLPVGGNEWNVAFAVGAQLDISAGSGFRIGANRLAWEQGLIGIAELEHAVVRDARKAFLELLLIRDTIDIYRKMVTTAEDRYNRAARRFEIGDARKVDMLSFQVAWQNMLPQLTNIENTYEIYQLDFRRLLGLPEDSVISLSGDIPAEEYHRSAETLIENHLFDRYDIQSAQLTIEQIGNEKGRRISEYWTPTFTAAYEYAPAYNDPFGGSGTWNNYSGGLTLWLNLPLDGLIPGTASNLAVRELNDANDAAELRLADTIQAGAIEIESAVRNLNKSSSTLRSLELNVQLAEESYDLVSRSYDVGEADYLQVQTADDDMNTARLQLLNERFNYASALQDLNFAVASSIDVQPKTIQGETLAMPYPTGNQETAPAEGVETTANENEENTNE